MCSEDQVIWQGCVRLVWRRTSQGDTRKETEHDYTGGYDAKDRTKELSVYQGWNDEVQER